MPVPITHWRSLTEAVMNIPGTYMFLQDKIFSGPKTHSTTFIDWDQVDAAPNLAVWLNNNEEAAQSTKRTIQRNAIEVPQIRIKKPFTAQELETERAPGTAIYLEGGPGAYAEQKVADELEDMKNDALRSAELMCGQAITGGLDIENDRIHFTVDYNFVPDDQAFTPANIWTAANATIIADIREMKRMLKQNLNLPTLDGISIIAIAGHQVVDAMYADDAVQAVLDNRRMVAGQIQIGMSDYMGNLAGVDFFEYDGGYELAGAKGRFVADDEVYLFAMLPGAFELHYGAVYDLGAGGNVAVPFFSKSWTTEDPSLRWILLVSAPMPIIKKPQAIVYTDGVV